MKPIIIYCIASCFGLCLDHHPSLGQYYGDEEISSDHLIPWVVDSIHTYSQTYHFGFSEGECELRIIMDNDIKVAQICGFEFSSDDTLWLRTYRNLTDVRIEGTKFFSMETNGEFMNYDNGKSSHFGLLLYAPWTVEFAEGGEFGGVYPDKKVYLVGKYPQASLKILTENELDDLSWRELKIMRNEIFARYGYIFRQGGEMGRYFGQQKWYHPQHKDVNRFLTVIEKKNIQAILKKEREE